MKPLLEVTNLHKKYNSTRHQPVLAVRGISFSVMPGECFGLLGPNGAGKSTSMKCITGFYPTTEGTVHICDIDVHASPKEARKYLGVCAQEETLDTDFSVLDQLVRYGTFFRITHSDSLKKSNELLAKFNLTDKQHEQIESLSGGMKRKLQVARSFISDPKVLILDEPTTGLDPEMRHTLWAIITDYKKLGNAILLSTHYMEEAERLCDRIAIMFNGVILDCAAPHELIEKHIGLDLIEEEIRPGIKWKRPPNLEDVYLKLTGLKLTAESEPK